MKNKFILIILLFSPFIEVFSQESGNNILNKESISLINYDKLDSILQINKSPLTSSLKLPIFTLGTGIISFHGDVKNEEPANFSIGCNGIHFEMMQSITPTLKLGLRYLHGEVRGNTYYPEIQTFYNFKTEINSFGTFINYDFSNIKRVLFKSKMLQPYASLGLSILQRPDAHGDWNSNGKKIYLWSDGSFRNMAESVNNASKASIVYRDYDYETSLQVENTGNKDYYTPIIASIPLELGVSLNMSKACKITIGYQYNITFSNTLDNITNNSEGISNNSKLPDGFSYAYVNFVADIKQLPKRTKFKPVVNENYFIAWDEDEDGIDETEDDCPYTPKGVEVFANGCPLDDDNDGIPNYLDSEKFSRAYYHDDSGKGITEAELKAQLQNNNTLTQEDLYAYYPDLLNGSTLTKQFYKKIPKKYRVVDIDHNAYISLEELLNTISSFFDEGPDAGPGANMTSSDLSGLIEFFFLQ